MKVPSSKINFAMCNKNLIVLFVSLLFVSCVPNLKLQREIAIDIGYPFHSFQYGTFFDSKGKEYLFFANLDYSYEIRIYDSLYQLVKSVPLKMPDGKYSFHGCMVKNFDTILVLSNAYKNNMLLYFDDSGTCYNRINLSKDVITKDNLFNYHFQRNCNSENECTTGDYLYLYMDLRESYEEPYTPRPYKEYLKFYYKHRYKTPYILKINLRDPKDYSFGGAGIQYTQNLCDTNICVGWRLYSSCANHKLFLWFGTTDRLFVCNEDMTVENELQIKSRFTSIGRNPYPCEWEDSIQKHHIDCVHGRISSVFYDPLHHYYYVIVRHKISLKKVENGDCNEGVPFSILIYDDHFNKKGEKRISSGKYDYLFSFMTQNGICLVKNSNASYYDPKKIKFSIYQIEK